MKAYVLATATLFAVGCNCGQSTQTAQNRNADNYGQSSPSAESAFMGPRGQDGPAGPAGPPGRVGDDGPAGYAMAGERGVDGPRGPEGPEGRTGQRGPQGEIVAGPRGEVGAVGPAGTRGAAGETGVRGESGQGYAGPAGRAGPAGPQGRPGEVGERGPQLVGPAGPAGRRGDAGPAGERGSVGAQGEETPGVAGAQGGVGGVGPQGDVGDAGRPGMAASLDRWVAYREFWFDQNENDMHSSDRARIEDIAAYMQENPNLELGIDGSSNTRAGSARDSEMASNRVNSIREALISAGVPANRISEGAYGDHNLRRDQRVDLLVRTSPGAMDRQRQQDQSGQQQRARSGNQADQQTQRAQNNGMFNDTVTENWEAMRTFWFDQSSHNIHPTDRPKVDEIAAYMRRNQSVEIGLDGTAPTGDANSQSSNRESAVRRSNAVREALIAAGVPASRIKTGAFGDEDHRRSGRVEVLIRMSQLAQVP